MARWSRRVAADRSSPEATPEATPETDNIPPLPPVKHCGNIQRWAPTYQAPLRLSDVLAVVVVLGVAGGGCAFFLWLVFGSPPRGEVVHREAPIERMMRSPLPRPSDTAGKLQPVNTPPPSQSFDEEHYIKTGQFRPPQTSPAVRPGDVRWLQPTPKPDGQGHWYDRYRNK